MKVLVYKITEKDFSKEFKMSGAKSTFTTTKKIKVSGGDVLIFKIVKRKATNKAFITKPFFIKKKISTIDENIYELQLLGND